MTDGALVDVRDLGHLQGVEQMVQMLLRLVVGVDLLLLLVLVLRRRTLEVLSDMRIVCHGGLLLVMVVVVGVDSVVGWGVRHERS